jgi:opacity protein-like surface antigen
MLLMKLASHDKKNFNKECKLNTKIFIISAWCLTLMGIPLHCHADTVQESDQERVSWDYSTNQELSQGAFLCDENEECRNWRGELRCAAVYPASKRFRRIYSNVEPEFQVEFSGRIYKKIFGWTNFGYLWDSGRSISLKQKTHLDFYTITFGLKYEVDISSNIKVYVGGGAAYGYLRVKNHSDFVRKHFDRRAWGGISKTGIYYFFSKNLYLDIFVDYLFLNVSKQHDFPRNHSNSVNLNGMRAGAGIGMSY